jgi:hypothetical protein
MTKIHLSVYCIELFEELNLNYIGGKFELLIGVRRIRIMHVTMSKIFIRAILTILMLLLVFSSALAKAVEEAKNEKSSNYVLAIEDGLIT